MDNEERRFWNSWNAEHREEAQGDVSIRQAEVIDSWLRGCDGLALLDAGCGTGWLCERLIAYGRVVGTDLADEVIERAQHRVPAGRFVAGDIMMVDVGRDFDVVCSLEVLSHVEDQHAFLERLHSLLVPGGRLFLATQNRPVLQRFNRIPPPGPGQRRRWVDRRELRQLLTEAGLRVDEMRVVSPRSDHGIMRRVVKAAELMHGSAILERLGFGWTIMAAATRPEVDAASS